MAVINLGTLAVGAAVDATVITAAVSEVSGVSVAYLDGQGEVDRLTVVARFLYGSGGTTCKAWLQTSFGDGQPWHDVACVAFATTSAVKIFNLTGVTAITSPVTPTDGALSDNTAISGVMGDRYRVKVTTTGVYANTTIDVKANTGER